MSDLKVVSTKRVRCSNFSTFEESMLVALVVKHSSILECKKSDHDVWESKNIVWKQIQDEFIASTGSYREIQSLKDKYENLKRKTKKLEGNRKKEIFHTGGGANASCSVASSATHDALLGILGVSAVGLNNPFDGDKPGKPLIKNHPDDVINYSVLNLDDASNIDVHLESETDEMDVSIIAAKTELIDSTLRDKNVPVQPTWTKWTPEVLKTQKSAELTTPLSVKETSSKTSLGESVKKYSLEKVELIAKQKIYFENEERRAQEKHSAEQLRAQEKHEWERVHHELSIEKLKHEINNLKKRSKERGIKKRKNL